MDLCLIAVSWYLNPNTWLAILEASVALGLVIFVHEFGHFAVAKLCGVKVEKFYLGFDIGGLKLARFRWGETDYGIGILPLGGYVKMLGQEDNPARLREEIERARQKADAQGDSSLADHPQAGDDGASEAEVAEAKRVLFDPRSYLAKSVPQRMAIISAGVIMNVIFALVVAVIAFRVGVRQITCTVGQLIPGEGAWRAGLEVGDEVLEVGGQPVRTFREMLEGITLGDVQNGVAMKVKRPGVKQPLEFTVKTEQIGGRPAIGITSSSELKLIKDRDYPPTLPGSVASDSQPAFEAGDKIVKVDDQPVESYAQLHRYLASHSDKPLRVTVERSEMDAAHGDLASRQVAIHVARNPMRQFGLIMEMGGISAIQDGSPAAKAGIQPGDVLRTIDGQPTGDPITLPDRLRGKANQAVTLGIQRGSGPKIVEIRLTLRSTDQYTVPAVPNSPVAVPELGIAYKVLGTVRAVEPDSLAAEAGIQLGDVIREAKILPPDKDTLEELREKYNQLDLEQREETVTLDEEHANWPFLLYAIQTSLPGTTVEFRCLRGDEKVVALVEPVESTDWFNPNRGWLFEPRTFIQIAGSLGEAVRRGARETGNAALVVYRTLHKIGNGDVSPRNLGGPIAIFRFAQHEAAQGMGNLLLFLTLLSANLAVLNFLPIPLLDGGHIVLLLWEGIRGKPADERVQEVLTYIGLAIILGLMVFVLGLDFGLISRPGR